MWKIERVEHEGVVVFALSGRIEDHDTVRFLVGCAADGTQLEHCPAYIRKWMARVRGAQ